MNIDEQVNRFSESGKAPRLFDDEQVANQKTVEAEKGEFFKAWQEAQALMVLAGDEMNDINQRYKNIDAKLCDAAVKKFEEASKKASNAEVAYKVAAADLINTNRCFGKGVTL